MSRSDSGFVSVLFFVYLVLLSSPSSAQNDLSCPEEQMTFELITGWMYSAPQDILETRAGTLQLADCLDACRSSQSCQAVNYETGLCVLFRSQAGNTQEKLSKSQFPVFTMYVQKICLPSSRHCNRAWAFEIVPGHYIKNGRSKVMSSSSRTECMEACLRETEFSCRSAWWKEEEGECSLSNLDRYSLSIKTPLGKDPKAEYLESQCVPEPNKMCEFKKLDDRVFKTVDSLHEGVTTDEECRRLCLEAPFRCHTYDFEGVCRLSHHSMATVTQLLDPYLIMNGSASWERGACYNVSLDCKADQLIAHMSTNKVFNGKIYSRHKPNSCVKDISNSLDFDMAMDYTNPDCGVRQEGMGRYAADLVLQHHDHIMTSADLGFALKCSFHLENKSVEHGVELRVNGQIQEMASESSVVPAPNVTMRITERDGGDIKTAQVGDPLSLRFEIVDERSPYEIFVRELIAMDGSDGAKIFLIDSRGCPTDPSIMGAVSQVNSNGKVLQAPFEAFKFPTSEVVQFQALVTPCLPACQPVDCSLPSDPSTGGVLYAKSYGRRRRSARASRSHEEGQFPENLLVENRIRIEDRIKFDEDEEKGLKKGGRKLGEEEAEESWMDGDVVSVSGACINRMGLLVCGSFLILVQAAMIFVWIFVWRRKRSMTKYEEASLASPSSHQPYFFSTAMSPPPNNSQTQQTQTTQFSRKFLRQVSSDIPNLPRL